jgi:uncharacterized peroxidase-related enzyme
LTKGDRLVKALATLHLESSLLDPGDRALLKFAVRLTRNPSGISQPDIEELRNEGFRDQSIHDLCQVVAYFNYVNRIADGLGVELEERFKDSQTIENIRD